MTEWGVVTVLIAIVGLIITVVTPLLKLNGSIVQLTTVVDSLKQQLSTMETSNSTSHDRIWSELDEHQQEINDHDRRIIKLEGKSTRSD